ncbi:TetR family transcriptional regulator [Bacillus sp. FJAT-27231]|uniref:TetR/AcrR family transcriptional regulator n=1 Tax=Bacillus sp. FJAT-27231 TaxID=1679168 RepID=UPI000670EFAB|nr:TetR/AcrR family transcriptional regulator [Bacillus sp. FJAT-27231]KMY52937.1 TetR family transcriptional regulator [Bacillus sp. FJAT-27231]
MNDRKQHVIKMAHQLFVEKGFQATSIQDILDYSGISKGTFYNYFSSKSELLMALFRTIHKQLEKERNELLIGQDPSNIEIFIKQIELQMRANKTHKLIFLFEEVLVSNDTDLKQFMKKGQLLMIRWVYERFIDIFGESKRPYLLDCAIMFIGILHHNLRYYTLAYDANTSIHQAVRYSVERAAKIVEDVSEAGDQLIKPELLDSWLPDCNKANQTFQQKLCQAITDLKKSLNCHEEKPRCTELLEFIQDELLHARNPRKFLIESALSSLKDSRDFLNEKQLQTLAQLVTHYFAQ